MKIVIANANPIHSTIETLCFQEFNAVVINRINDLTYEHLKQIEPDFVFFLHWSNIIPKQVYENFNCILFHMTDLPFGRGGSPLQNLIVRGHNETVISAIKVSKGIDTGPIFLKKPLSLAGSAEEIFSRSGKIMLEMMREIIDDNIQPIEQEGQVTVFKRRTPYESNLESVMDIGKVYDFIRMLDAPGYPKAFIETEFLRFEFSGADLKKDEVIAKVKIIKK